MHTVLNPTVGLLYEPPGPNVGHLQLFQNKVTNAWGGGMGMLGIDFHHILQVGNSKRSFLGEDKTWTRGLWTPTLDRVYGPLSWTRSMDPLSWTGSMDTFFFLNNEKLTKTKIVQK